MSPLRSGNRHRGTGPARPGLETLEAREVMTVALPGADTLIKDTPAPLSRYETVGMFDPVAGAWYLRGSNDSGLPNQGKFFYGSAGDKAVTGDWNGDGVTGIGVYRDGVWYLRNSATAGAPDAAEPFAYGSAGWIPVVGDWNGDGKDDIGVFDPATATWYLRTQTSSGAPDVGTFQYGPLGSRPVVGDWNGDGKDGIGVFDPATANWYVRDEASGGAPDASFQFGVAGWKATAGDFLGTGRTQIAVLDPNANWYLRSSLTTGVADVATFQYGAGGWTPLTGAWSAASPLYAEGQAATLPVDINQRTLDGVTLGVLIRFQASGLPQTQLNELAGYHYVLADLAGDALAVTDYATKTIYIDYKAAGRGWFVDTTVSQDEEYNSDGTGKPDLGARNGVDLVTVLVNQMTGLSVGNDGSLPRLGVGVRNLAGGNRIFGATA